MIPRPPASKDTECVADVANAESSRVYLAGYTPPRLEIPNRQLLVELGILKDYRERWKDKSDVIVNYFEAIATADREDVIAMMKDVEAETFFDIGNPYHVRFFFVPFCTKNLEHYHDTSGAGYKYIAGKLLEIDAINHSAAHRLIKGFEWYPRLDPHRKALMGKELERILQAPKLSQDVRGNLENIYNQSK